MAFNGVALHQATVTRVAAVVVHGVGIENFAPFARLVNAEAVVFARHRREVAGDDDLVTRLVAAYKDKHRALVVVHHQPLKAVRIEVQLVQRFVVAIGQVQVTDQTLYAVVPVVRTFQQMPVKAGIVVPFAALSELVTHKQQLLPGKANSQP